MSSYSADYSRFDNIADSDDETDVMDKYHATGETVEVDALDVTGLPAELGGALKACTTRPTRPKNRAFLFIKPKAATPAIEKLVEATLASRGIKVLKKGTIDGPTIDKKRLIDQHYYAIASKATLLKPSELPVPEDKFEAFFGVSFQDALKAGTAVNALQACEELQCTPDELRAEWRAVCASNDMIKFGGGFYCGKIKGYQVFNPFFKAMRSVYTTKDAKLVYFGDARRPRTSLCVCLTAWGGGARLTVESHRCGVRPRAASVGAVPGRGAGAHGSIESARGVASKARFGAVGRTGPRIQTGHDGERRARLGLALRGPGGAHELARGRPRRGLLRRRAR